MPKRPASAKQLETIQKKTLGNSIADLRKVGPDDHVLRKAGLHRPTAWRRWRRLEVVVDPQFGSAQWLMLERKKAGKPTFLYRHLHGARERRGVGWQYSVWPSNLPSIPRVGSRHAIRNIHNFC